MSQSFSDAFKALVQYRQQAGVTSSDVYFQQVETNTVRVTWRVTGTLLEDGHSDTAEYTSRWFSNNNSLLSTLQAELPFLHRHSAVLGGTTQKPLLGDMVLGSKHR